ncbi:MAG TPA: M56 family metallopeptidase [Gammaproteobacteria bacterium]|nr:M56 family metallopeptidase [Gammaproteobacteria bacterium]
MLTEIVNHLWQSTLFVAAIAALAALLREHGAHARYWLWWSASVKFLVPFSLLTLLGERLTAGASPFEVPADWSAALGALAEPMPEQTAWPPLAVAALAVWGCGFLAVLASYVVRALRSRALLRGSVPFSAVLPAAARGARVPDVRCTAALVEPSLVGIARPVLLLPQGITERLSRAQLDAVLAHELCHFRRRDNLTAVAQMAVEAVFWFHPFVWWVGARLVDERERACDEAVVGAGHDGRTYAEGILNVCEHYVASSLKCSAGVSGADLKRRVVEIGRGKIVSALPIQKKVLLGAFALSMLIVPVIFGGVSGRAVAQQSDRDVVPLVRIAPTYPATALADKREGWVKVEFTITPEGRVADVVVVESSAPDFNDPTVASVSRWMYAPQPVERRGVQSIIRYQLQP